MRHHQPRHPSRWPWAFVPVLAFLLFASGLRAPITGVPPLVRTIGEDLSLSTVAQGLLTSIPVLCFGLLTPLASTVLRRIGINVGGAGTLVLVAAGSVLRSAGGTWALFLGTAVIGVGITFGNLIAPMIIGRDFRRRAALLTGMYSASINVIVTASTALAVPLATWLGWRASIAAWGTVPVIVALLTWVWVYPRDRDSVRPCIAERAGLRVDREPVLRVEAPALMGRIMHWRPAWLMAFAFCGHTFSYYAFAAWLPTALSDMSGMGQAAAGVAASVFQLTGILGPLLVPVVLQALHWSEMRTVVATCAAWLVLPLGLLVAPQGWLAWSVFSGIAQGAFFTVLFTLVIRRTRSVDENRTVSALVQTIGYIAAALGPVTVGWVHALTGGWQVPFAVVAGALAVMTVCAVAAVRDPTPPPGDDPTRAGARP